MNPKSPKWLDAIRGASAFIVEVSGTLTLDDYLDNFILRSAIERNIEIIGESLLRLERNDPALCARVSDYRKIIGLRNRLAHGYETEIDHAVVWNAIVSSIPVVLAQSVSLLSEAE